MEDRLSWDDYFLEVVKVTALRATCDRGRSGCVITKNNRILVTGYVGSIYGFKSCNELGHLIEKSVHSDGSISEHCVRCIHAEQNAICQAAITNISIEGGTLYCTMTPCRTCAMLIAQCKIVRVVCSKKYHQGQISEEIFKQAGIKLDYKSSEILKYK
ncbi:MAG: cytidine/deoxycytidylate deaminase family protein [Candidatus Nanoarchaeia archaeon]|jgi:dCMP deaminase|nr:cytidine/deoxycytidylate deaminase family protein [Candidatus Nanoarchaeia archaeon]